MNCPNCGQLMTTHNFDNLPLEVCDQCGGTWVDAREFSQMKDTALPDAGWLDFDLWKNIEALKFEWSERLCPICESHMATLTYADTGVMVDVCIKQHGGYLDKGEFQAILEALEVDITSKNAPEYLRETLRQGSELITGDEPLHTEWQDFTTVFRLFGSRLMVEHPQLAKALAAFALGSPK